MDDPRADEVAGQGSTGRIVAHGAAGYPSLHDSSPPLAEAYQAQRRATGQDPSPFQAPGISVEQHGEVGWWASSIVHDVSFESAQRRLPGGRRSSP